MRKSRWIFVLIGLSGCSSFRLDYSLLKEADEAYAQQHYADAAALYEENRKKNREDFESLLKEADALKQIGQFDAEEKILLKAVDCDQDKRAQKVLAEFYLDRRQGDKAQGHYEDLCAAYPDDASLMNRLGVAYDMQGIHDKAQEQYQKALQQSPTDASYQSNYALSLSYMGRYEEAVAILKPLASANIKQRHNLAMVYALMQRIEDFHQLLKDDLTLQERESLLDELSLLRKGDCS